MAIQDRWTDPTPGRPKGSKDRTRNARWGKGKRWQARWVDETGHDRYEACRTKEEAQALLDDMARRQATGLTLDPTRARQTVAHYAARWLPTAGEKESARVWNAGALEGHILPRWGTVPVGSVTTAQVIEWAAELAKTPNGRGGTLSASRRRGILIALGGIMQHAVRDRAIAVNPVRDVELPVVRRKQWTPPPEETVHALYAALRGHYAGSEMVALVASYVGPRWGEIVALDVTDLLMDPYPRLLIDDAMPTVQGRRVTGATKTHAVRGTAIPAFLAERLVEWVGDRKDGPLIPGPRGGRFSMSTWRRHWTAATTAVGLSGVRPHQLRHVAASRAIGAGADVKVVQHMLGHATAAMTLDVYGHLLSDRGAEVATAMDRYAPPPPEPAEKPRRLRAV